MTPVARTTHLDLETGTGITTGEVWDSAGQETHYGPTAPTSPSRPRWSGRDGVWP
ncbi:hypothetical protein [Rhodococcus sp. AG1013]|uniref:hypothetical protein n=1 Tax=unclassified Rhodococcus (in: high G+C Gram-positive bacteria) TaxID=192944 RepID=UPI000E2D4C4A|nr:hypothetical protein [Rhodococcus sp. AG1013]RDI24852.1 hypothetical protein DEU38_11071 [Rhodococcus sp. AG1013]